MESPGHVIRAQFVVVLAAIVIAACGGAGSDSDAPSVAGEESNVGVSSGGVVIESEPGSQDPGASNPSTAVAVASARLIDDKVDFRTGVQSEFASLVEPVDVAVGDVVRTDVSGFGEITYFEGSITRLDVDTEFEITALVDDPGNSEIRTRMGLGRTWHRVEDLTGDDTYSVETSVATATVRGTAFTITCVSETECRFDVFEGTVEIELPDGTTETIDAPGALVVSDTDESAAPEAGVATDAWIDRNRALDTDLGFAELVLVATGSPGGVYDVVVTVEGYFHPYDQDNLPPMEYRTSLEFTGACDGVGPCSVLGDNRGGPLVGFNRVGAMTLTPMADGAYSGTLVESENESTGIWNNFNGRDCPIVTTAEFEVTLTATSMTATFSHVPDPREGAELTDGSGCGISTFDLTLTGTRPV